MVKRAMNGIADPSLRIERVAPESLDLSGKKVVVVGGTNGLGRALARFAATRGAMVTIVGRVFREEGTSTL